MERITVSEISKQIRGVSYKPENLHDTLDSNAVVLLRANNIDDGKINFDDIVYIDKSKVSKEQYLQKGDILVCASSGSKQLVGKAASVDFDRECTFGAFCKVVRPIPEMADYLGAYFQSSIYRSRMSEVAIGANINNIRNEHIAALDVPIRTPAENAKIVQIINLLQVVIDHRKIELQKLDNLVKARFVEMFGIYPANQMGWETGKIRDTVADVRYGSSRPAVDGGKYPYLRMNNITYGGELDLSDVKRIDVPENELNKCTVRRGDVLFNRTNSKELVGKTCVYDRDEMMVLAGFVIRVRVNDRVLPEFLSAFLNTDFSKKTLSEMCKAAIGQANINAQEMQNIGLYLPPLELQRQFVQFKKQIDKSKVVESIHRMNVLFNITLNGGNRYDIRANEF